MTSPYFILLRPQMGENIGAAARAMLNFGHDRLRIVAPRDGWPNPRAVAMASGAGRLLDSAGLFADLAAATADCTVLYATTARARDLVKPVLTPEAAVAEARALAASGAQVGFLFGPERTGLETEDILPARALVRVPVNPEFPSLNLAQCVLLMAYEWARQGGAAAEPTSQPLDLAAGIEIEKLGDHWQTELEAVGYFFPESKAASMQRNLRAMWSRFGLTRSEVQTLHGMLRQLLRQRRFKE